MPLMRSRPWTGNSEPIGWGGETGEDRNDPAVRHGWSLRLAEYARAVLDRSLGRRPLGFVCEDIRPSAQ